MSNKNLPSNILENKYFRDSVATVSKDGNRKWVFPKNKIHSKFEKDYINKKPPQFEVVFIFIV